MISRFSVRLFQPLFDPQNRVDKTGFCDQFCRQPDESLPMKFLPSLLAAATLPALSTGAWAAKPAAPLPPSVLEQRPAIPAPAPAPPSAPAGFTLDKYLGDLAATLKLSDADKKEVEALYVADGDPLKAILNNEALSPLQQAEQVSDLRDTRNAKIEGLLLDIDRQREFRKVEAKYRVALTLLAADGGLVAAPTPAPSAPGAAK